MKLNESQVDETEACLNSAPEGTTVPHLREVFCATCNNSECQWSMATKLAWMSRMKRLETGRQHKDERPPGFNGIENPGFEAASKTRQWAVANNIKDDVTPTAPKESPVVSPPPKPPEVESPGAASPEVDSHDPPQDKVKPGSEALDPYSYEGVTALDQSGHFDHHKAQAKPVPSQILLAPTPQQSPWAADNAPSTQKKKKVYRIQDGKPSGS